MTKGVGLLSEAPLSSFKYGLVSGVTVPFNIRCNPVLPKTERKIKWVIRYLQLHWMVFLCVFFSVRLFVGSTWSFVFFIPQKRPMTSNFEGFSIPDFIHYIYFPILILEKEPAFPFWMFSAKQGNYLVPFL